MTKHEALRLLIDAAAVLGAKHVRIEMPPIDRSVDVSPKEAGEIWMEKKAQYGECPPYCMIYEDPVDFEGAPIG